MKDETNIVLVLRSGGDFKFTDVYLLVTHINKYWQGGPKPNVYCYTDLVNEEQSLVGLTLRPLPNPEWKGWWSKMNLFTPQLANLRPFFYLDLDTAVIGNLSLLIPRGKISSQFITLQDFYRPTNLASGVMWIPKTAYMDKVYKEWMKDTTANTKRFRGDQNFIESVVKADSYWQQIYTEDAVTTFKPNKIWRIDFPASSKIVCFHGKPRIPEAANSVEWVKKYINYAI